MQRHFITFGINKNSYIILKVFNINGMESYSLVEAKQNAGTYEVKFDGSAFASGIYFYKLQVLEQNSHLPRFTEIKKMVLIK